MSHLRYWHDCLTGLRHQRWFVHVGRPERAVWWPCAKAALILPPLLGLPGSAFPPLVGGWAPSGVGPAYANGGPGPVAIFSPFSPSIAAFSPGSVPFSSGISPIPSVLPPGSTPTVVIPPSEQPTRVPEPASLSLVAIGSAAAIIIAKRSRNRA